MPSTVASSANWLSSSWTQQCIIRHLWPGSRDRDFITFNLVHYSVESVSTATRTASPWAISSEITHHQYHHRHNVRVHSFVRSFARVSSFAFTTVRGIVVRLIQRMFSPLLFDGFFDACLKLASSSSSSSSPSNTQCFYILAVLSFFLSSLHWPTLPLLHWCVCYIVDSV